MNDPAQNATNGARPLVPRIESIEDLRSQVRLTFNGPKARQFAIELVDLAYSIGKCDGITELGNELRTTLGGLGKPI